MKNIPALTNERQKAFIEDLFLGKAGKGDARDYGVNLFEVKQTPEFAHALRVEAMSTMLVELLPKSVILLRSMLDKKEFSRDARELAKLVLAVSGVKAQADEKAKAVGELSLAELHAALAKAESKLKLVDQKPQASRAKLPSFMD